jgi:hypothetical protein
MQVFFNILAAVLAVFPMLVIGVDYLNGPEFGLLPGHALPKNYLINVVLLPWVGAAVLWVLSGLVARKGRKELATPNQE